MNDPEAVTRLHATLRPHLLRRVIKDVEKVRPWGCPIAARSGGRVWIVGMVVVRVGGVVVVVVAGGLVVGGGSGCCAGRGIHSCAQHRPPAPGTGVLLSTPYPPALPTFPTMPTAPHPALCSRCRPRTSASCAWA